MSERYQVKVIARMHSLFPTKFGIPRQSGLVEQLHSLVVFEPEYRDPQALRGIEEFSHLWLIWQFSEVRPGKMSSAHSLPPFPVHYPFSIWVLQRIFNCNCNAFGEWKIFPRGQDPLRGSLRQTEKGRQKQKARSFGNDRACAYCAERDAVTSDNPA